MGKLCVLIASFNRRDKTLSCLSNLYGQINEADFDVFLADDCSKDGTSEAVKDQYPNVVVVVGTGSLYWAGSMRLAWNTAINSGNDYQYFLLLNDDTLLYQDAVLTLLNDLKTINQEKVILIGSTLDPNTNNLTYGGRKLIKETNPASLCLNPNNEYPQLCDLGNANIMLVTYKVINDIGILSDRFTHGIADYDYTLRAKSKKIPTFISSKYLGVCENDHGNNWLPSKSTLNQRLKYLYSIKGLAYYEYLYYIKSHFPKYVLIAKTKLWLKTFFPIIWDRFK